MKKIILIGGDLASGKSTYSVFLAKKYNITLINKDRLKEICGDVIYVSTREENKKLSVIAFNMIKYFISATTSPLIVESNFKDYEMAELKELCRDMDVLSLRFTGDNKMLHERFLNRLNENRHYVHKSQDFSKLDDFVMCLEDLRKVNYIGKVYNVVVNDSNTSENEELDKVVRDFLGE